MADSSSSWLAEFDDDVISYRRLFTAGLGDFRALALTARRRHAVRARVLFLCAVTVLTLVLPSALTTLLAVQLSAGAGSPLAVCCYALFAAAVLGSLCAVCRSVAVCRAACGTASREALLCPESVVSEEASSLLEPPPVLVRRAGPVRPPPALSTAARPLLVQSGRRHPAPAQPPPPPLPPPPPPQPAALQSAAAAQPAAAAPRLSAVLHQQGISPAPPDSRDH